MKKMRPHTQRGALMHHHARCARYCCRARRVAYGLCSTHWFELCDRAHVTTYQAAAMFEEAA
ncbi:hypothetical protein [Brachybacterium kimchii]|uniref:Uncharacterized protein n=1 Tax=Brachybacterium kimchii TaxID=2942909 RepID=A0ABY4N4G7_9MICO|nr:hypothetical protein [Brachybacterium kimchii]UQN29459.1 hypothetical protein M4486_17770 [Brachybacterium kimchii]